MSNADNCAYCGRVRASDWHRVTSNPGTHAFVEPAPQRAPSLPCNCAPGYCALRDGKSLTSGALPMRCQGVEAKVREIADKYEKSRDAFGHFSRSSVHELAKEAYAAGKADGAREEREACGKLGRDVQAHYERQILVEQQSGAYQGEVVATAKREIGKRIADAIARRGSEGT